MKKLSLFIILILSFNLVVLGQNSVQDSPQTQTSLGVDPAILEIVLNSDTPTIKQVTLTNYSNLPQPIKTLKQSFTPKEKLDLTGDELKIYDSSSWITIDDKNTDFILQPHQSKKITITINQPANATPGGHYATIIFQPLIPQELVSQESIYVYARVAVLVFMQVKGDIVQDLDITNTNYATLSEPGNHAFDFTIKNTGNTHIQPSGKLNIYDALSNQILASETIPSSIILPKTEKPLHFNINLPNQIGKYSAELVINYGSESVILQSGRKDFYIFPFGLVFLVLLPAGLLIFFVIKYRSRLVLAYHALTNTKIIIHNPRTQPPKRKKIRFKLGTKISRQIRKKLTSL
jgi:hypothetical protein